MFRSSPEISAVINRVCRDPAFKIVTEYPDLDLETVSLCISQTIEFMRINYRILGDCTFIIKFDFSGYSKPLGGLTAASLLCYLESGVNVLSVDENLNVLGVDVIQTLSHPEIGYYSKNNGCLVHVFGGVELEIYAKGIIVSEVNALAPAANPTTHKKNSRNANNYWLSILDHYKKIRYGGVYSEHWDNREDRILKTTSKKKTEKIFHESLFRWLDENLEGASVFSGVKKISDDETDIEVRLFGSSGRFFVIEVKWLGYNGHTRYTESRLRDGILQVNEYIERDKQATEVCLVAYDGRPKVDFDALEYVELEPDQWKLIIRCQTKELLPKGKGYVFFLESATASDRGH